MRPDALTRASAYIASPKIPRAVAGQGGDKTTYTIACALAVDFALDDAAVRDLLNVYNRSKCDPAWSDRDIERFVRSARRTANGKPGDVGKALERDAEGYDGPKQPAAKPSQRPAPRQSSGGAPQPAAKPGIRTARTPEFKIRRAGEGAEPRTARTLRTVSVHSFTSLTLPPSTPVIEKKKETVRDVRPVTTPSASASDDPVPVDRTMIWADGEVWKANAGKPWRQLSAATTT